MSGSCARLWGQTRWYAYSRAKSLTELLGPGAVAALGYVITGQLGEQQCFSHALTLALVFVLLGAFEGLVVGWAQAKVLQWRISELRGRVREKIGVRE